MTLNDGFRIIVLTAVLLNSCFIKSEQTSTNHIEKISVIERDLKSVEIEDKNNSLLGAWGNDELGNAVFAFYSDSIYYPDPNLTYKYDLNQDTLTIYKEDNNLERIKILKMTMDSLILNYLDYEIEVLYKKRK